MIKESWDTTNPMTEREHLIAEAFMSVSSKVGGAMRDGGTVVYKLSGNPFYGEATYSFLGWVDKRRVSVVATVNPVDMMVDIVKVRKFGNITKPGERPVVACILSGIDSPERKIILGELIERAKREIWEHTLQYGDYSGEEFESDQEQYPWVFIVE